MTLNRQWTIAARPVGRDVIESDFAMREGQAATPGPGQVVVKVELLGFDPALKGWMENIGGYVAPTEIGDVMRGSGIGTVVDSGDSGLAVGATVIGPLGWQDYATLAARELRVIERDDQMSAHLGVLGTTGLTAFLGLQHIGKPLPGRHDGRHRRGRSGRLDRRADRQDRRLPGHRHRWRRRQMRDAYR